MPKARGLTPNWPVRCAMIGSSTAYRWCSGFSFKALPPASEPNVDIGPNRPSSDMLGEVRASGFSRPAPVCFDCLSSLLAIISGLLMVGRVVTSFLQCGQMLHWEMKGDDGWSPVSVDLSCVESTALALLKRRVFVRTCCETFLKRF